jgi:hypothetical protein
VTQLLSTNVIRGVAMPSVFLRALSRGTVVYEWSVAAGVITGRSVTATPLNAVDRIQFFDPALAPDPQQPRLQFSVFGGLANATNLPTDISFRTRCFLTPQDQHSFAQVELKLIAVGDDVMFSKAKVFGQDADAVPHFPIVIADLTKLTFTAKLSSLGAAVFATPNVLSRLGISGLANFPGVHVPVLVCVARPYGFLFQLTLPLLNSPQHLGSYGLEFKLTDPGIPQSPDGTPTLVFSQWDGKQPSGQDNFWLLGFQFPSNSLLQHWNDYIATPILDGLNEVRNGLPASFLPTFTANGGTIMQCDLHFSLIDKGAGDSVHRSTCVLRDPDSKLTPGFLNIVNRAIQFPNWLNCTARFPNLISADGTSLQAACVLGPPPAPDDGTLTFPIAGFNLGFKHRFDTATKQPVVRMGALDFAFPQVSQAKDLGRTAGAIRGSFRTVRQTTPGQPNSQGDDVPGTCSRLDFLSISMAIPTLAIGGQDSVPGSEYAPPNQPYPRRQLGNSSALSALRAPALQIAVHDFPPTGDYFILDVTETCYELSSQTLSLAIEQQRLASFADGNPNLELIIIDPEPFLVARVTVPDYQASLRAAITDRIATWDNNAAAGGWQIAAGTPAFQLTLPPQGVGEAMHKAKGLDDLVPGRAADYRFTPTAQFSLQSTSATQRFVEVPWNLRRNLGYPLLPDSGAILNSAEFELVYGISAKLSPPLKANPSTSTSPGWMLSEIAARLGNLAAAPNTAISWQHTALQETYYENYIHFWASVVPQLRTRLAVLEPWSTTQPDGLSLTDADGLVFTLRSQADLAYPAPINTKVPDGIPQGQLKGSFAWVFESQVLYESIWGNTPGQGSVSFSAALTGLHFSSLGGWGDFTARYNLGKTSIIASVRMGRVQTITVEQIGRIANFWNKAKYVITYERTVAATAQFAGEQYAFPGNPILRKTAEYVQILERFRLASSKDTIAGAYSACEFPEGDPPRIPVSSAWGENVDTVDPDTGKVQTVGYKIPLWRPGARPTAVYVKPLVRLQLQGAVSAETVPAEIQDPEKLFFYTSVDSHLTVETDTWPAVPGVDFGFVSTSTVGGTSPDLVKAAAANAAGKTAGFQVPEEPWTHPGLGAFTYHLKPSPLTANLVAGFKSGTDATKAANAIGTTLRTITLMRGLTGTALLPGDAKFAPYVQSLQIPDQVSNILRPLISQVASAEYVALNAVDQAKKWADLAKSTVARAQDCVAAVNNFGSSVPTTATNLCAKLTQQFQAQLNVLNTQISNEVAAEIHHAFSFLKPVTAPADLTTFRTQWAQLYASARSNLRFTRSALQSATAQLKTAVDAIIVDANDQLGDLNTDLGTAGADLAKAQGEVQGAAVALDQTLTSADAEISTLLQPIAGGTIDNFRQALSNYRVQASQTLAQAVAALAPSADPPTAIKAAQKLVTDLSTAATNAGAQIDVKIQSLGTAADGFVSTRLETTLDSINTKLLSATDLNGFYTAAAAELDALSKGFETTLQNQLTDIGNNLAAYADVACKQILQGALKAALTLLTSVLDPNIIQGFLNNLQSALPSGTALQQQIEDYLHSLESSAGQFLAAVRPDLTIPPIPVSTAVEDAGIALLRAFGDVPKIPQLDFPSLDFSAFRFAEFDGNNILSQLPQVNLTPLAGLANTLANGIGNPLNLAVPSFQLLDNLQMADLSQLGAALPKFDLNSLFPHIAGLNLANLFQGVKFPDGQEGDVKVTHGEDVQARSAWLKAEAHTNLSDPVDVFSYFGVVLTLETARFDATTSISGKLGSPMSRTLSGSISGNWSLTAGGYEVVILEDCALTFDESGKFGFNVDPAKVHLQGALEFIADLLANFFSGDGFTTSVTPAGLQTVLDLPLPDIQSGSFGMANLHLMCSFGITFAPFAIHAGLSLASQDNPFTLTVFILGGAGFLALDVTYTPDTNNITAKFSIGIFASASLAISLGPISGGVYAYFGIAVAYTASTGHSPDLQITLALMLIGEVSLLGFISVYLSLSLSGTYDSGTKVLIGNGTVRYSIKIGPFFSIDVHTGVSYKYSNHAVAAVGNPLDLQNYLDAANEYLEMFYN